VIAECFAAAPHDFFVGLYVERGVGERAAPAFGGTARGRRLTMDRTWLWARGFEAALRSGEFEREAAAAENAASIELTAAVDGGLVQPPSGRDDGESDVETEGVDFIRFRSSAGRLAFLDSEMGAGRLAGVEMSESLAEFADRLKAVRDTDWVWIDFHIGVRLAASRDVAPGWSAAETWRRACAPWQRWLW
jgi:hypothetical protein